MAPQECGCRTCFHENLRTSSNMPHQAAAAALAVSFALSNAAMSHSQAGYMRRLGTCPCMFRLRKVVSNRFGSGTICSKDHLYESLMFIPLRISQRHSFANLSKKLMFECWQVISVEILWNGELGDGVIPGLFDGSTCSLWPFQRQTFALSPCKGHTPLQCGVPGRSEWGRSGAGQLR